MKVERMKAIDIAKWFIWKNNIERIENVTEGDEYEVYEGITHLKVQKLLYYAQGISLSLYNEPLFDENIPEAADCVDQLQLLAIMR